MKEGEVEFYCDECRKCAEYILGIRRKEREVGEGSKGGRGKSDVADIEGRN